MTVQLTEKQKKNGWQIVKFAEIAKNVSKRVDPTTKSGKGYGVQVASTWYWYERWVDEVEEHCRKNKEKYRP